MFKLNLDMNLYFTPPMTDVGRGICVTREFELPFPPTADVFVTAEVFNGVATPLGYNLNDLTWDIDRETFFAHTGTPLVDDPIALIPMKIQSWIDRGWRLGSYESTYEQEEGRTTRFKRRPIPCTWDDTDDETASEWERMKPSERPESFNKLFDAVIREMLILNNNPAVAYAMRHTHIYIGEEEAERAATPAAMKFQNAKEEYERKDFDAQYKWRDDLLRRCPHLDQFLILPPKGRRA